LARVPQNIRKVSRTATHYPATIVDKLGGRASARLSGNGATIHDIPIIGGPVDIGDDVLVDFSTPDPTIITTSKEWLTMDDLMRELAKLKTLEPEDPMEERPYWWTLRIDDNSFSKVWPTTGEQGWYDAIYYEVWELWENDVGFPDIVVRWPPGVINRPEDEHMDELYDGGTMASHIGVGHNPPILNNTWATALNGNRFENISFRCVSTYSWTTGYNFYWWFQDPSAGTNNEWVRQDSRAWYDCIFRNCLFSTIGYPEDIYPLTPGEYDGGIPYACHWILDGNDDSDYTFHFYDCEFYARTNPSCTGTPAAIHFDSDVDNATPDNPVIYLHNCKIDCGPQPFNSYDWNTVYAYNCQFIDYNGNPIDPTTINNLVIMDDGDRSPVNHIHTSGSSGAFDANAIHTNVAGEW
jgi:hypothetical protein